MSTSDPAGSGRLFVIDRGRTETERTRLLLRLLALLAAAVLAVMAVYALHARGLHNYRLSNLLVALSPLPLFAAFEAWLACRRSALDRVCGIELRDGHFVVHSVYARAWRVDYPDIAGILVRYRGRYSHYDHMSLVLTLRGGATHWLGHCRGETLERLAAALRDRSRGGNGRTPGTAAKDRAFRLEQRWRISRWAALFFLLCGIGLLVRMSFIEHERHIVRTLERDGVRVEARMTTQFIRPDHVLVFYLFRTPEGNFEKGGTRLPVDPNRELRQGSTIPVLYSADDPALHRGAGALPAHAAWLRWLGWLGVAVFLCVAVACLRGWDALLLRGRLRLVGRNELAEDALPERHRAA